MFCPQFSYPHECSECRSLDLSEDDALCRDCDNAASIVRFRAMAWTWFDEAESRRARDAGETYDESVAWDYEITVEND